MNDENFPEGIETVDLAAPGSKDVSKVKTYRITKENARQFALSSAAAKRRRKQAREREENLCREYLEGLERMNKPKEPFPVAELKYGGLVPLDVADFSKI